MSIDELIQMFGYTRRILVDEYDSNLGLLKAGLEAPGNYDFILKPANGFILASDRPGFGFSIYDFAPPDEADNHAYDGTEEWREAEKKRLGLTDVELETKIYLDTLLV